MGREQPRAAVTFHDLRVPYLFPKAGPLRRWIVHELARGCDLAITTNRDDQEALRQALRPERPVQALVPIGSNIAPPQALAGYDRDAWRARWGVGPGDLLLCFFGFVNDRKGVDTLLQALKLLVAEPGEAANPHLVMIGGQTGASDPTNVAYLARIRALIDELGLGERVRWTGYTPAEEVSANFWAADLCVLPFRDGASFLHGTFHAALAHGMADRHDAAAGCAAGAGRRGEYRAGAAGRPGGPGGGDPPAGGRRGAAPQDRCGGQGAGGAVWLGPGSPPRRWGCIAEF